MKTLHRITKNRAFTHRAYSGCCPACVNRGSIGIPGDIAARCCSADCAPQPLTPRFFTAVAFDVSPALRSLPHAARAFALPTRGISGGATGTARSESLGQRIRLNRADGALQLFNLTPTIPAPLLTFEGMSNQDNFNIFGFRVNPPDPKGEVGPNHYVEMINLVYAVCDKAGNC